MAQREGEASTMTKPPCRCAGDAGQFRQDDRCFRANAHLRAETRQFRGGPRPGTDEPQHRGSRDLRHEFALTAHLEGTVAPPSAAAGPVGAAWKPWHSSC